MDTSASLDYASPLLSDTTPDAANLVPPTSLLHLPGRPLTLADFPPSQTPPDVDLPPSPPEVGTPYQRRFTPQPLILPTDQTRCAPIGIWPSASARKLFPGAPGLLRHGLQLLLSTLGPFSVISAILGSFNSGSDTVLTFWQRAEAYMLFAWNRADCYPAHRVSLHTIHTNLDAYRDTRSLSLISGLRLPYIPSLLEIFQRCSTPRLQPVLYYIVAGAYSGPLRVIDLPSNSETWYQVADPSTLLKRMVRNPYLTLMDAHHQVHGTIFPLPASPAGADLSLPSLVPYYPPLPDASTPPVDRAAFGSDALTRFPRVVPDSFPIHPPVAPTSPMSSAWSTLT